MSGVDVAALLVVDRLPRMGLRDLYPAVAPLAQIEAQNREQFGSPGPELDADALCR